MKGEIAIWKENNLIISPITGTLYKSPVLETNNSVEKGQFIAKISPAHTAQEMGTLIYATTNAGKVKPGQKII
ncbi:MAG: hypothetical protein HC880_14405 [Bacteroidia bacterium]|nr:hypothetical protein [Bacteroidia bacterium]